MKIAIQLITYFNSADLPELLDSLRRQTFLDWRLFVYENSCDQKEAGNIQALLEAAGLSNHFFISDRNTGFTGGHQALFAMHDAPFVLLLNPDAKLEPDYLAQTMRRMESDAKIGSVTGLIFRPSDGDRMVDTAGLEYRCLGQIVDRFAGQHKINLAASEVFGVSGAIGLYRREAIDAAGGLFDPTWFMYKEDADLAIRLKRAGFTAWFEPAAIAFHRRGLKEEGSGWLTRLRTERQRPSILRRYSYANQWRIYRRFWSSIDWRDRFQTIKVEFLRSLMTFLVSPRVFFDAWRMILKG